MDLIELEIMKMEHGVSYTNSYAVILLEKNGNRTLPVVIGSNEARSIAIGLEQMETPRPLTHDLITNIFDEMNVVFEYVHIHKIVDGIFHAHIICKNEDTGVSHAVDSRTSDALAVAVRVEGKIFVNEDILNDNGMVYQGELLEMEEDELVEPNNQSRSLEELSVKKLKALMKEMLENENYEEAARIRDAIKRKQS